MKTNPKFKIRFIIVLLPIFFCTLKICTQETSAEKLLNANSLYKKRKLHEVIELCKICSNESTAMSEQWNARSLLAMDCMVK